MKMKIDIEQINKIVDIWKTEGKKVMDNGVPVHPEYMYRLSNEWKGWNDFLGTIYTNFNYAENEMKDELEDSAYCYMVNGHIPAKLNRIIS